MTIRAGRFFRAGTQGQGFFKAETGSDARINRSYADLFKGTAPEPDDSGGLGMPPTAEEGRELMEWDASPENQRHRMSDLMPLNLIQAENPQVTRQTLNMWVGMPSTEAHRNRGGRQQSGHGGSPSRPPFPEPVTPRHWGSDAQPNRNRLWKREEVKQYMLDQGLRPTTPTVDRLPKSPATPGEVSGDRIRPTPPPIATRTVSNLLSNMDKRFQGEGGSLPTEGSKDEHGNWRDDK
jgi:hypothetical protein